MKFTQLKLDNAVLFNGAQTTYIVADRYECTMELKDSYIVVNHKQGKDNIIIPLTNVIYAKIEETNDSQTRPTKQVSSTVKS